MSESHEYSAQRHDPRCGKLETLAIQGYQSGKMTQLDVGRLLGLTRLQAQNFLARHVDLYGYSSEELEAEAELLKRLPR